MRHIRAIAGVTLLPLLVGACGGSSTPSSSASATATQDPTLEPTASRASASPNTVGLPEGWERVEGEGFSIGLPSEWQSVAAADIADAGIMDELRDANPAAGPVIDQAEAAMRSGQIQLFAFDPGRRTERTGFAANTNVIHVGGTGGQDLAGLADEMADAVAGQIPINGQIRTATTTLPMGEAATLDYTWDVGLPGGESIEVAVTQYLIATDSDGYIVTFTGPSEFARRHRAVWETIAFSFRLA